jgi:hypothetical protein
LAGEGKTEVLEYFNMEAGGIYLLEDQGQHLNLAAHQSEAWMETNTKKVDHILYIYFKGFECE